LAGIGTGIEKGAFGVRKL